MGIKVTLANGTIVEATDESAAALGTILASLSGTGKARIKKTFDTATAFKLEGEAYQAFMDYVGSFTGIGAMKKLQDAHGIDFPSCSALFSAFHAGKKNGKIAYLSANGEAAWKAMAIKATAKPTATLIKASSQA